MEKRKNIFAGTFFRFHSIVFYQPKICISVTVMLPMRSWTSSMGRNQRTYLP